MSNLQVILSPNAEQTYCWLQKRDPVLFKRIRAALEELKSNPFIGKRLKHQLQGYFSLRVGSYRIIYVVIKARLLVNVIDIGHRREIYQK